MKQKLITSIALAYIAADLTGWYETFPERLICGIGLGLAIAAVWTKIEEIKFDPGSCNSQSQ